MPDQLRDIRARLRRHGVAAEWLEAIPEEVLLELAEGLDGGGGVVALPSSLLRRMRGGSVAPPGTRDAGGDIGG